METLHALVDGAPRASKAETKQAGRVRTSKAGAQMGVENEQYYTNEEFARECIQCAIDALEAHGLAMPRTVFDPSAGRNTFATSMLEMIAGLHVCASDIDPPESAAGVVEKRDFLDGGGVPDTTEWPRPVLGGFNPPYGKSSALAIQFAELMRPACDYVVFLVPFVVVTKLLGHYHPLVIRYYGASIPRFTVARNGSPFRTAVALFVGHKRAVPFDIAKHDTAATSILDPHFKVCAAAAETLNPAEDCCILVRRNGVNAGKRGFYRGDDRVWYSMHMSHDKHPVVARCSEFEGVSDFDGVVMGSLHAVIPISAQARSITKWGDVLREMLGQPLPGMACYSNLPSIRLDNVRGMLIAAICALPDVAASVGFSDIVPAEHMPYEPEVESESP